MTGNEAPTQVGSRRFEDRRVAAALLCIVLVVGIYLLYRAAAMRIEYFDGYVYLGNARILAGDRGPEYTDFRPPLVSLVHLPLVAAARLAGPANLGLLVAPHVLSALLSLLGAACIYWLFRPALGRTLALLGTALFVSNRLFLRYGPFALSDVLVTTCAIGTIALYLRARASGKLLWYALCGFVLACTVMAKYSAGLLAPVLVLCELFLSIQAAPLEGKRWYRLALRWRPVLGLALTGIVSAVVFFGTHALVFTQVYGDQGLSRFWKTFVGQFGPGGSALTGQPGERWTDYFPMVATILGVTVCALAVIGVWVSLRRPRRRDAPFLAWLLVFGGGTLYLIGHTEARYAMPVLPALIYFAVRAFEAFAMHLKETWSKRRPAVRWAGVAVLAVGIGAPLANGGSQVVADHTPVFFSDVERRVALAAASALRGQGRLMFMGFRGHTLFPPDPGPLPLDEHFNTFDFAPHVFEYYLGRPLERLRWRNDSAWNHRQTIAAFARDGDVIVRFSDVVYTTKNFPPRGTQPPNFEVWSMRRIDFRASGGSTERLQAPGDAGALTVRPDRGALVVIPEQTLGELWAFVSGDAPSSLRYAGTVHFVAGNPVRLSVSPPGPVSHLVLIRVEVTSIGLPPVG
jgi:hypothetical protein